MTTARLALALLAALPAAAQHVDHYQPAQLSDHDSCGWSVAANDRFALIGSPFLAGPDETGVVYTYSLDTGLPHGIFVPADGELLDRFGWSVAIHRKTAIIGAPEHDGAQSDEGAVYVFDISSGQLLFQLASPGAQFSSLFGSSVATNGEVIAVAAGGERRVHVFDFHTGQLQRTITPASPPGSSSFGYSVAVSGDLLVAGDPNPGGNFDGVVYSFDLTTGDELAQMTVNDPTGFGGLGSAVAIDGTVVATGAPNKDNGGAAYLFDALTGQQLHKLLPDAGPGSSFGESIAISEDTVAVGAPFWGSNFGTVRLFDVATGSFQQAIDNPDPDFNDWFGRSVAISEAGSLIVGANGDSVSPHQSSGSAYAFHFENDGIEGFCFGLGCPCGNDDPDAGCRNDAISGAHLLPIGSASISDDDLVLRVSGLPTSRPFLVFMGAQNQTVPFGDGRLCVAGKLYRFVPPLTSGAHGIQAIGPGLAERSTGFNPSGWIAPGSTWTFQAWYANPNGPCGSGYNTSSAVRVTFVP